MKTPLNVTNFLTPVSTELSRFLLADNQPAILNGVNPSYKQGSLLKDLGYGLLNATNPTYGINGLFDFRQSATVQSEIALVYNQGTGDTELWHRTTGTWTKLTTPGGSWLTSNNTLAATSFVGSALIGGFCSVSGNFLLPVSVVEGNSPPVSTQTNVAGMPCCKYLVHYRDRVYAINCYINDFYKKMGGSTSYSPSHYTGVATTSGSPTITMTSTSGIAVGMYITGTGVPANTTIIAISGNGTTATMSANATATNSGLTFSIGGSPLLTSLNNTDFLYPGQPISGTGIPVGATVVSVDSVSQVTMSADATAGGSGLLISFGTDSSLSYPYRFYFSSKPLPVASTSNPLQIFWGNAVTGTSAVTGDDSGYVDLDFSEELTGAGVAFDELVVFTANNAYTYDQTDYKQQNWPGCANHSSIQSAESFLIYANLNGLWFTTGAQPQCVSAGFTQLIRNSDPSLWSSAVVDRVYSLFLGNTSADGISYSNCILNYDLATGLVWWREMRGPNNANLKLDAVMRSGTVTLHIGDSAGNVFVKSKYTDDTPLYADNGAPIYSQFRTKAYDMGDPTVKKMIASVIFYSENARGLKMFFRTMDSNTKELQDWKEIGCLDSVVKRFEKSITGHFIEFKGEEYSTNPAFSFYGFSALESQSTHTD